MHLQNYVAPSDQTLALLGCDTTEICDTTSIGSADVMLIRDAAQKPSIIILSSSGHSIAMPVADLLQLL